MAQDPKPQLRAWTPQVQHPLAALAGGKVMGAEFPLLNGCFPGSLCARKMLRATRIQGLHRQLWVFASDGLELGQLSQHGGLALFHALSSLSADLTSKEG